MDMKRIGIIISIIAAVILLSDCGTQKKLKNLRSGAISAGLRLTKEESKLPVLAQDSTDKRRDTLRVKDLDGKEVLVMKAVLDKSTGAIVASEQLDAAIVTARFRNVAERHGQVDLEFQIIVSDSLQDSKWQLRFEPEMYVLEDTVYLNPVFITGREYRKYQLRGYQQYNRFLESIARDSLHFVDTRQLEVFLERNIPQLYKFKTDSSFVSEEEFQSSFGITQRQAIEHFTNQLRKKANADKIRRKGKMWDRYVKAPIIVDGIRLDTVIHADNGTFVYTYVQPLKVRSRMRKVDVVLRGSIHDLTTRLYTIPPSQPLSFYISSLSSLTDNSERYVTKIIERRAVANTSCNIEFASGKFAINTALGNNKAEIGRIKNNLNQLMSDKVFDLDSVTVLAGCSPEGSYRTNAVLAQKRAESVSSHFKSYIKHIEDSLTRDAGFNIDENGKVSKNKVVRNIKFKSTSIPEDWTTLDNLVEIDSLLSSRQKDSYAAARRIKNPDEREQVLRKSDCWKDLFTRIFPKLRRVQFNFFLHRKGMVKDTVHTTVLDSVYMSGVQAIRDRDYDKAVETLGPYADYNTAVAYAALDRNASAMAILEKEKKTARVNYLLAILYSRQGDHQAAVQHYMHACQQEPSYVHRGNLDPEISELIKRYKLNTQPDSL